MADHSLTEGAVALKAWLAEPGRSQSGLAEVLRLNQSSVSGWVNGWSRPDDTHRDALELLTGIAARLWRKSEEIDLLERLRSAPTTSVGVENGTSVSAVTRGVTSESSEGVA